MNKYNITICFIFGDIFRCISLPVDPRNLPNAVLALHIPSILPVKTLRLIAVWVIVFLARISSISLSRICRCDSYF